MRMLGAGTVPAEGFKSGAPLRRIRALARLHEAVSTNRHASGVDQVWRAAFEKRCQTLLSRLGFEHPADLSPQGDRLLSYSGRGRRPSTTRSTR